MNTGPYAGGKARQYFLRLLTPDPDSLYRAAAAADTDFYRIAGTLELFVLMRAQGYSARTFKAALHKYATRKCERLWKGIAKLIDHM